MSDPDETLEQRLRRDAQRVQPTAGAGFAERVRAARSVETEAPIAFPRGSSPTRWPWALAVAAALVAAAAWVALDSAPAADDGVNAPRPVVEAAAPETAPETSPEALGPVELRTPDFDLATLMAAPSDPLDAEVAAITADIRSTGSFLLACLPDYPVPEP